MVSATVLLVATAALLASSPVSAAPPTPDFGPAIEGYAGNDPQDTCDPTEKPGPQDLRALLNRTYDLNRTGNITRECHIGGTSEHKEGRALDYALDINNAGQRAIANDVLNWMLATDRHGNRHAIARRWGIMYIIWNRQIWSSSRASEGWRPYSGDNPHTDHIHWSFSWRGARKQTSWWTAAPVSGGDSVGYFNPADGSFHLRNALNSGGSNYGWVGGPAHPDIVPLTGDWDGNGRDSVGYFDRRDGSYHLRNSLSPGASNYAWDTDIEPGTPVEILSGDWDGNGRDSVGYFDRRDGSYHLRNALNSGASDYAWDTDITPGMPLIIVTGDWDGR